MIGRHFLPKVRPESSETGLPRALWEGEQRGALSPPAGVQGRGVQSSEAGRNQPAHAVLSITHQSFSGAPVYQALFQALVEGSGPAGPIAFRTSGPGEGNRSHPRVIVSAGKGGNSWDVCVLEWGAGRSQGWPLGEELSRQRGRGRRTGSEWDGK